MKLWGGRFKGKTDPGFAEFNNSFRFDRRLFAVDVVGSIAYCRALEAAGVEFTNGEQPGVRISKRAGAHSAKQHVKFNGCREYPDAP